eukprot:COSAG02_NODE_1877_length_10559_cov_8.819025_17_plen_64_part_01
MYPVSNVLANVLLVGRRRIRLPVVPAAPPFVRAIAYVALSYRACDPPHRGVKFCFDLRVSEYTL